MENCDTIHDMKKAMSFRLSEEAEQLLQALAQAKGVSKTAAVEIAIRDASKQKEFSDECSAINLYKNQIDWYKYQVNLYKNRVALYQEQIELMRDVS